MTEIRMARCWFHGTTNIKEEKEAFRMGCNHDCNKTLKAGGTHCQCERPSTEEHLFLFEAKPEQAFDRFYCGCKGWD